MSTMMVIKKEGGEAEEEDDMDVTEKQKKKLYKFVKLMKGVSDDLLEYAKDMKTHGGLGRQVFNCSTEVYSLQQEQVCGLPLERGQQIEIDDGGDLQIQYLKRLIKHSLEMHL